MSDPRSESVKTRLSKSERERLEQRATSEQRSVSWIIRKALLAYLNGAN
jgi:predicted transcriptional regulator